MYSLAWAEDFFSRRSMLSAVLLFCDTCDRVLNYHILLMNISPYVEASVEPDGERNHTV
jgi:hypothetical protein